MTEFITKSKAGGNILSIYKTKSIIMNQFGVCVGAVLEREYLVVDGQCHMQPISIELAKDLISGNESSDTVHVRQKKLIG